MTNSPKEKVAEALVEAVGNEARIELEDAISISSSEHAWSSSSRTRPRSTRR
jgi:hypothetical protein